MANAWLSGGGGGPDLLDGVAKRPVERLPVLLRGQSLPEAPERSWRSGPGSRASAGRPRRGDSRPTGPRRAPPAVRHEAVVVPGADRQRKLSATWTPGGRASRRRVIPSTSSSSASARVALRMSTSSSRTGSSPASRICRATTNCWSITRSIGRVICSLVPSATQTMPRRNGELANVTCSVAGAV